MLLLALALAFPAGGEAVLILTDEPREAAQAVAIADETARRLGSSKRALDLLDPERAARNDGNKKSLREKVDRGLDALEALDLGNARDGLEEAVLGIAALEEGEEGRALREALLGLAVVALYENDALRADGLFVGLAAMGRAGGATAPPVGAERYPSKIVTRYAAVEAELESRPTGRIAVTSDPPGATIFVDGIDRGQAPAEIGGLAEGLHVVALRHPWLVPVAAFVDVVADDVVPMNRKLDLGPVQAALDALGDPAALAPDGIYVGHIQGGAIRGEWIDAKGRAVVPELAIGGGTDSVAQRLADAIAKAGARAPPPVIVAAPPIQPEDTDGLTHQWWFWAGVGGAIVLAAGAVAIAAQEEPGIPRSTAVFGF